MQTDSDKSPASSIANEARACIVAHARGALELGALTAALKGFACTSADAAWEILSLLDQYHRRGALSDAAFNALKEQITRLAFNGRPGSTRGTASANTRSERGEPTTMRNHPQREPPAQQPSLDDTNDLLRALAEAEDEFDAAAAKQPQGTVNAAGTTPAASPQAHAIDIPPPTPDGSRATAPPPQEPSRPAYGGEAEAAHRPRTTRQAALIHSIAPGKILDGRFIIESELSFGRYTAVYRARDRSVPGSHNVVALKILLIATPVSWAQFEREQQIAQRLSHPQLVATHEMQFDKQLPFFTMGLIEGNTLGALLKAEPPRRDRIQLVIARLVAALKYLHEQQLAHGDLHPDNVMISTTGEVKLIDYGAMNFFGVDPQHHLADVSVPPTASLPDTPIYASCQRLDGEPAEPRDDIFSLSCIAYELLAGHHPFKQLSATRARTLGHKPAPIPLLQPHQWNALQRGLAWEREDRIASVTEWFAGFSGGNDAAVKQPMPPPAAHEPVVDAGVDTSPRWTPPDVGTREPPQPPRYEKPAQPRRWPLILTTMSSTIAVMVILQSELGVQLRAELAAQWARIQMPTTTAAPTPPTTSAGGSIPVAVEASETANDTASMLSNDAVAATGIASTLGAANAATSDNARPESTSENDSVLPVAPVVPAPASPVNSVARQTSGETVGENVRATSTSNAHGKISFSNNTFTARKTDRYVPITINRSNGTAGKATFVWWTEPGSAEEGADYLSYGRKTEVLGNGKRRITVFVPLIADLGGSKGHVFFVNLGDASNGVTLGQITRAKVVIADE